MYKTHFILTNFFPGEKNSWKFVYTLATQYLLTKLPSIWQFLPVKKFGKVCLHSSNTVQNSLHFDEFFSRWKKFVKVYTPVTQYKTTFILTCFFRWKNSWKFVYIPATQYKTTFILTCFFRWKIRESLFTFQQHSTKLPSFWRFFYSSQRRTSENDHVQGGGNGVKKEDSKPRTKSGLWDLLRRRKRRRRWSSLRSIQTST